MRWGFVFFVCVTVMNMDLCGLIQQNNNNIIIHKSWKKPIFLVHRWLSEQPWTRRYHVGVTILPGQPQDWAQSPAHDALVLLKASFSAPKLMHTLRAAPCSGHAALQAFYDRLIECVCTITNTDLTDVQSIQNSLPVRLGGLDVWRLSLAPSAFLASAAGTRLLQDMILSSVMLQ